MAGVQLWHKLLGTWEAGKWPTAYQHFLHQCPGTAAIPMTFLDIVELQETINSCEQIVL